MVARERQVKVGFSLRPYFAIHPLVEMPQRIPPEMALAIARRESEFYPKVESPVGALGMMQGYAKDSERSRKKAWSAIFI